MTDPFNMHAVYACIHIIDSSQCAGRPAIIIYLGKTQGPEIAGGSQKWHGAKHDVPMTLHQKCAAAEPAASGAR